MTCLHLAHIINWGDKMGKYKKWITLVLIMAVLALFIRYLQASLSPAMVIPYGVWENKELGIVMYIEPHYQNPEIDFTYPGTKMIDGEKTKVFVVFERGQRVSFFEEIIFSERLGRLRGDGYLVGGSFQVHNRGQNLRLVTGAVGIQTFYLLEEYESPNPEDWLISLS